MFTQSFTRLQQAYQQALWRRLRQWWGVLALTATVVALLSILHLALVSWAAIAGREIEILRAEIAQTQSENIQLAARYAEQTAYDVMYARAVALGYRPVAPEEQWYVYVDGYISPGQHQPDETVLKLPANGELPVAYTQSLTDWVLRYLQGGGQ